MMRSSAKSGYLVFMEKLHKEFTAIDTQPRGGVTAKEFKDVLVKHNGDAASVEEMVKAFKDASSSSDEAVCWIEALGYLSCCSNWYTMRRLHHLDIIRRKQGMHVELTRAHMYIIFTSVTS
jgi:hypothetical protein